MKYASPLTHGSTYRYLAASGGTHEGIWIRQDMHHRKSTVCGSISVRLSERIDGNVEPKIDHFQNGL